MKRGDPVKVVFDANLFVQAVLGGRGPAFGCLELVDGERIVLIATESVLAEVEEVLERLAAKPKYRDRLTPEMIGSFIALVRSRARILPEPPHAFDLVRDRDDELYIDLAVACGATYITTSDRDLLDLMRRSTDSGAEFSARFPAVTICGPVDFLQRFRSKP